MKNKTNIFFKTIALSLCLVASCFFTSCESAFEYDLAEANSKPDTFLPGADFSHIPDGDDFTKIYFTDLSVESNVYGWDFAGLGSSTDRDPSFTFPGEGVYPVTLTVSDSNGATDSKTIDITVVDIFVAIIPTIENGDFEDDQNGWKFESFTDGTTNPFNSSSDGSWLRYDGTDNGSKTRGAKWTMSTSAGVYLSSNTRYAYQALVVSPDADYVLEFEYAIKDDGTIADGGNRLTGEILDGHFSDGKDAVASSDAAPLARHVGTMDLGKTVFTTVKEEFTSNSSGEISIMLYGVTDVDAYIDNVKVYPK